MIFKDGDEVYSIPGRFWEEKEPIKCCVKKEKETDYIHIINNGVSNLNNNVLVYSEEYRHDVYMNRADLFYSRERCRVAINLYSRLHELYFEDESDICFERCLKEDD